MDIKDNNSEEVEDKIFKKPCNLWNKVLYDDKHFKEDMILDVFDEETNCPSSSLDINDMDMEQLDVLQDMREDDLSDIKNEIENTLAALKGNTDGKDVVRLKRLLTMNSQKKQMIVQELRMIKNRIKMMEDSMNYEEVAAA